MIVMIVKPVAQTLTHIWEFSSRDDTIGPTNGRQSAVSDSCALQCSLPNTPSKLITTDALISTSLPIPVCVTQQIHFRFIDLYCYGDHIRGEREREGEGGRERERERANKRGAKLQTKRHLIKSKRAFGIGLQSLRCLSAVNSLVYI